MADDEQDLIDRVLGGGGGSSSTTTPSAQSTDDFLAELNREGEKAKRKNRRRSERAAGNAGREIGEKGLDLTDGGLGRILSVPAAAVATALTAGADDYLVGKTGQPETIRRLEDLSVVERLFGENQLSLADPLKAVIFPEEAQRATLEGTEDVGTNIAMGVTEGVGLLGDIFLDPLNLLIPGGAGAYDDAIKAADEGAKIVGPLERLAAKAGDNPFAARAVDDMTAYNAQIDEIDNLVAAGAMDPAQAVAEKTTRGTALREAYERLNGEEMSSGFSDLQKARWERRNGIIPEAPTSRLGRSGWVTERVTQIAKDIARYTGEGANTATVGNLRLAAFDGMTANEVIQKVNIRGFAGLSPEVRETLGVTGRLWRANPADIRAGRAFNPFSRTASSTLTMSPAAEEGIISTLRRASLGDLPTEGLASKIHDNVMKTAGSIFNPGMRRSGQLWKAAIANTIDDPKVKKAAVNRVAKLMGKPLANAEDEAQMMLYPLTILNQARLDAITRAGGKALRRNASQAQIAVSKAIHEDADGFALAGLTDDVVPTADWSVRRQKVLEVADNAEQAQGAIKDDLSAALDGAMRRAGLPDDLSEIALDGRASELATKAARRVVNDPQFGQDIAEIARRHADSIAKAAASGKIEFGEADLARAALNALTNMATIASQAEGITSFTKMLAKGKAWSLFTPRGAEAVGREAKLLSQMEDLGLAVIQTLDGQTYSTEELHDLMNVVADEMGTDARVAGRAFEDWLEAKADLTRGLRARGVAEAEIASIENRLAEGIMTADSLRGILDDASRVVDEATGIAADTDEARRLAAQTLRDIEGAALKLEETHLALLDYRDLNAEGVRLAQEAADAAEAAGMATVATGPLLNRLNELLEPETDWLLRTMPSNPTAGTRSGQTRASVLLRSDLGEDGAATSAGIIQQQFNRMLSQARDVFGNKIDLEKLADHSDATYLKTKMYGQTRGALNRATRARFFQQAMPPKLTAIADSYGGWERVLEEGRPEVFAHIENAAKILQRENANLSNIGIARDEVARFMFSTLSESLDAIVPLVDDFIDFMETGRGFERLERAFVGPDGVDVLRDAVNGDLGFLDNLLRNALASFDIAISTSGGFGDVGKFAMLRQIAQNDTQINASFTALRNTLETLESASFYLSETSTARQRYQQSLDELGAILGSTPNPKPLKARRDDLVDFLNGGPSLPEVGERAALTAQEAAEARRVLGEAKAEVRRTARRLETANKNIPKMRESHAKALADLQIREANIELMEQAVESGQAGVLEAAIRLDRSIETADGVPLMATMLGGNADFRAIKGGYAAFAADPRINSYVNAAGELVERSPERVAEMWVKRLERTAQWIEKVRDRAVNGYTTPSGKVVPPVTRYDVASAEAKKWAEEAALDGFGLTYGKMVGLADEGAARAMIQIATNSPQVDPSTAVKAWDLVLEAIKGGYVGTAGFSTRNLMGGSIANARQGVSPRLTKKIWAADSMIEEAAGAAVDARRLAEGSPERLEADRLLAKAEKAIEDEYGAEMVALIKEAKDSGISDSSLYGEITGTNVVLGADLGGAPIPGFGPFWRWVRAVREASKVGRLSVEAEFGSRPALQALSGVTSAVAEIPRYPAAWYERRLAGDVERIARAGKWSKVFGGRRSADSQAWGALTQAAQDVTVHPGVESLLRTDLYVQRRLAGDTPDQAFTRVMEVHIDYSDMTKLDTWMRRILPFWMWRSRSVAHYAEMMIHHPQMAKTTFSVWNEDRRGQDPRTPITYQQPGTGLDPNSGLALSIPDPGLDLLSLFDQTGEGGPLGPFWESAKSETIPPLRVVQEIGSGYTAEGVPIDTPTSIQGPMNAIANSGSGGLDLVEKFAYLKKGKWYWRYPGAARAFDQMLPLLSNVSKVTTPLTDGDGITQKTAGMMAQFFGSPVRFVPEAQQERARIAAATAARYDRMEEAERRRRG